MTDALDLDAVVFGGGVAGLWTLDELSRRGARCLLLEANELGSGQTIASQGIIHGGVKYSLSGLLSASARAIADMPDQWRHCLAGDSEPNLSATKLRAHWCVLWQTSSLKSRLGMLGARAGLRVSPKVLAAHERPLLLQNCPGVVARLDEQVIEPWSLISNFWERNRSRIVQIDSVNGLEFVCTPTASPARVNSVRLINPENGQPLDLRARFVVLAAGSGNAALREACGLSPSTMQKRPLHMVVVRGSSLVPLNGHCTDGASTRVTITSTKDFGDVPVWQVGGQVAERGVAMDGSSLIRFTRRELEVVLPGVKLAGCEWATYRIDRAEAANDGARPNDMSVLCDGNVITAWPTKLVLAPRVAQRVCSIVLGDKHDRVPPGTEIRSPADWPRPTVALPPWETNLKWSRLD